MRLADGTEWMNQRELDAAEEENRDTASAYRAVVERARAARKEPQQ